MYIPSAMQLNSRVLKERCTKKKKEDFLHKRKGKREERRKEKKSNFLKKVGDLGIYALSSLLYEGADLWGKEKQ